MRHFKGLKMVTTTASDPNFVTYLATAGMGFDPGEMHRFRRSAPIRRDPRSKMEQSFERHPDQSLGISNRYRGALGL